MKTDKQALRNALSDIEDRARELRFESGPRAENLLSTQVLTLIARLAQIVREDIVE